MVSEASLFTFCHWTHHCDVKVVKNYVKRYLHWPSRAMCRRHDVSAVQYCTTTPVSLNSRKVPHHGALLRGRKCFLNGAWSQVGSGPGGCMSGLGGAWWRPPRTATAAGGTHRTGMHSCFDCSCNCDFYSPNRNNRNHVINRRREWTIIEERLQCFK